MFKEDFPFSPRKFPFYYGWIIMVAALLGTLSSLPGQTAGFSAFTNPLIESLNISRSNLATAYFFGTVCSGFLLPKAGRLLDQYGTRKAIVCVYLCLGLTLFVFSHCEVILQTLSQNLPFINREVVYVAGLAGLVLGIRFFGQGLLPIISNTMVGRWFDKKRGKVVAVMGVTNSLAFNTSPAILAAMVAAYTWQGTWKVLAIVMGLGFVIFSWLFFRDNPEECGLFVDGEKSDEQAEKKEMVGMTVFEAQKTLNFKVTTLAISLFGMTLTGVTFHLEAIGIESGLSKKEAMSFLIPISFISVPVGFATAWLSDKFSKKALVLCLSLFQTTAYLFLAFLDQVWGYWLAIVFIGLSGGMFGPIYTIAFAWFFGRKFLGSINGKVTSYMVVFSAIGPLIFSFIKDWFGSFTPAFYLCAVFPALVFISGQKMKPGELFKTTENEQ